MVNRSSIRLVEIGQDDAAAAFDVIRVHLDEHAERHAVQTVDPTEVDGELGIAVTGQLTDDSSELLRLSIAEEVAAQVQNGDIGGLEFLVSRHQVKAVRIAYLITRDVGLAEDVVQDALIKAYHAIDGFDSNRPFEPWFLGIVVNAAVKMMQRDARQVAVGEEADAEELLNGLMPNAKSVEEQVEESEFQEQIWSAMQKLSPRQRAVIVQRYFLDMSEIDMANQAGVAPGSVKWTLHAARERLRELLAIKE